MTIRKISWILFQQHHLVKLVTGEEILLVKVICTAYSTHSNRCLILPLDKECRKSSYKHCCQGHLLWKRSSCTQLFHSHEWNSSTTFINNFKYSEWDVARHIDSTPQECRWQSTCTWAEILRISLPSRTRCVVSHYRVRDFETSTTRHQCSCYGVPNLDENHQYPST